MKKKHYIILASPPLVAISFALATYAYYAPVLSPFNSYEATACIIFWIVIVSLVLGFPLRGALNLFTKYVRTKRGLVTFVSYSSVHLILYGLLLEIILGYIYRIPADTSSFSYYFASTLFYPLSLLNVIAGFGFNPSLSLIFPPIYNLDLTLYGISLALIIAILVTSNVMRIVELGDVCNVAQKSRAFVLLPALGVIGGAACCLSLPLLISLVAPAATILSNSPAAYYVAYFVFPPATAVALKYNMDSTDRIATKIEKIAVLKRG